MTSLTTASQSDWNKSNWQQPSYSNMSFETGYRAAPFSLRDLGKIGA